MQTLEQLRAGKLAGATKVKIAACLTEFPPELFDLADSLEYLDLSGNRLTELPADFTRLQNLKIAFFSDNDFTVFPEILGALPNLEMIGFKACRITHIPEKALPPKLRWLILTNNQLTELPKSIGAGSRLQKLMLAGNKLRSLPPEMAACRNLELIRISANELPALPDWLFDLPRLAWLAFAGNSFNRHPAVEVNISPIPWHELTIAGQLGEGASGNIYRAGWHQANQPGQSVAVKIFKGEITSDGLPDAEMLACMAAGNHPNLVPVLGQITGHPAQKKGLVLNLIPPTFTNLGNPPSLQTCTRDTYPAGITFTLTQVSRIAQGIASAAAHLHARGIMHGDLYAHNILTDETAQPLFGDFGAAVIYDTTNTKQANLLERLEVRAFGCLLEDLLNCLNPEDRNAKAVLALDALKSLCLNENIWQRPAFKSILLNLNQVTETQNR